MIDTANMSDDEVISHFPAEACTELGADQDDMRRGMQMLSGVVVTALIAIFAAAAVML